MSVNKMLKKFVSSWGFILGIFPFIILLIYGSYEVFTHLYGAMAVSAYTWGMLFAGAFILTLIILLAIGIVIIKSEGDEE